MSALLMDANLLRETDRAVLAAYCVCWARWAKLEKEIESEGVTTAGSTGNTVTHPRVKVAAEAMRMLQRFIGELGLSPVARMRLTGQAESKAPSSDILDFCGLRIAQ